MAGGKRATYGALGIAFALVLGVAAATTGIAFGSEPDDCVRLHAEPRDDADVLTCLPAGSSVTAVTPAPAGTHDAASADTGLAAEDWQHVTAAAGAGWIPAVYLEQAFGRADLVRADAIPLPVPPPGGLTLGPAGTSSLGTLIASQRFEVSMVLHFDIAAQRFRMHVVGSPVPLGSLEDGSFRPDDVVFVQRAAAGSSAEGRTASAAVVAAPASLLPLRTPPEGGLTVGLAGAGTIDSVVAAQPFAVEAIGAWDVLGQRWLMHRVGGPAFANTLRDVDLTPLTPVFVRRAVAPPPEPTPAEPLEETRLPGQEERVTYYFCERGTNRAAWGDGGGFCGRMANGEVVHAGGAACHRSLMGQRFRIEGDPTEQLYTCTDTGGAVRLGHRDIWFANSDDGLNWYQAVGPRAVVIPVE